MITRAAIAAKAFFLWMWGKVTGFFSGGQDIADAGGGGGGTAPAAGPTYLYYCQPKSAARLRAVRQAIADMKQSMLAETRNIDAIERLFQDLKAKEGELAAVHADDHPDVPAGVRSRWIYEPRANDPAEQIVNYWGRVKQAAPTENLVGVIEADEKLDLLPADGFTGEGSIQTWFINGKREDDPHALDIAKPNGHLVKNHCQGRLSYNQVRRAIWGVHRKQSSSSFADLEAIRVLQEEMSKGPLGFALTKPEVVAAYVQVAEAPVPGSGKGTEEAESAWLAGYDETEPRNRVMRLITVRTGKTIRQQYFDDPAQWYKTQEGEKPVYIGNQEYTYNEWRDVAPALPVEVAQQDPWSCEGIPAHIPGWSPTNAYIGAVKDSQTAGAVYYSWQDNAEKYAEVFTTGSAYTCSAFTLHLRIGAGGALTTGEVTIRIYAGDPTGAQITLFSGTISVKEINVTGPTAGIFLWFGGGSSALANATIYTLEMTTTCPLTAGNFIGIGYVAAGGVAGNQAWKYTGGAWGNLGASMLNFVTCDNSDGGKFNVRTDDNYSHLATVKGAAVAAATDTITCTMGATLTTDAAAAYLQARTGDCVAGSAPVYAAQTATWRYGHLTFSAATTTTFIGNATANSSGLMSNPTTADASSKGCTLTINGTTANPVIFTNNGSAWSATKRYAFNWVYGLFGNMGVYQINYPSSAVTLGCFLIPISATYTTAASFNFGTISMITGNSTVADAILTNASNAALSIPVTVEDMTINGVARTTTALSTYPWYNAGTAATMTANLTVKRLKVIGSTAARTNIFVAAAVPTGTTAYFGAFRMSSTTDIRATVLVPLNLTLTAIGNGMVQVTVTNFPSTPGTTALVLTGSGQTLVLGDYNFYHAAWLNKPADCFIVAKTTLATLTGWTAQFSDDLFVKSPASVAAADCVMGLPSWPAGNSGIAPL